MRSKKIFIFITILSIFALVLTGCGSSNENEQKGEDTPAPAAAPAQAFDAYRDMLIPMAQEKVDAGELTTRQADYIISLSREGKYPRGAKPGYEDALNNPPEVPADWDGPKEVIPAPAK